MKKMFLAVVFVLSVLAMFTAADAQNVKTITWSEFWRGVEFGEQANGRWEFIHGGRGLHAYTVVEVPANTLVVRHLYNFGTMNEYPLYLAVLKPTVAAKFEGRPMGVRMLFVCDNKMDDDGCRQAFSTLLYRNIMIQSLGVANSGYEGGVFPETPIFSFLVNMSGKFIY